MIRRARGRNPEVLNARLRRPLASGALALRRRLLALADHVVPAPFALFDQLIGDARARTLAVVTQLAIPDALGERRRNAAELAGALRLDADILHRVLRALALEGIVRLDRSGRFRLTRKGHCLRREDPGSMRPWVDYWSTRSNRAAWDALETVLRTGRPAFPAVHGMSVWTWFAEHPDEERLVAGDIFAPLTAAADVYLLKNVLHDYDDEACVRILRNVAAAMPPGASLVVVDNLQETNVATYPPSMTDLQMAVVCDGGRERSRAELHGLLRRAGLTPSTVHVAGTGLGLVAGRR